jgi:PAS domain S-box-containing protein
VAAETVALAEPEPVVAPPLAPVATAAAETAPAETIVSAPAQPAPRAAAELPALPFFERRHPLRFVWQIDAEGRFTLGSDEFVAIAGPSTATVLGRTWAEIAAELDLDPEQRIAQALATRDTWSGLTVAWPIDGSDDRLSVELSGLPSFDRERQFRGYRGFGVCRDIARLNDLARRRSAPAPVPVKPAVDAVPEEAPPPAPAEPPVATPEAPTLSTVEHHAFYELSRRLTHLNHDDAEFDRAIIESASLLSPAGDMRQLFDRLPVGVMIYRLEELIYANGTFLQAVGYDHLDELIEAGGLDGLLIATDSNSIEAAPGKPCALTIVDRGGESRVDVELIPVLWESEAAHALLIRSPTRVTETKAGEQPPDRDEIAAAKLVATQAQSETAQAHVLAAQAGADAAHAQADAASARAEIAELHAILDTATDGVIVLDRAGSILSANRSAEALFGYDARELAGRPFLELFAPESVDLAAAYLDSICEHGVVSMLNNGRDVIGRVSQGGYAPLFMSLGRIGEEAGKLCAVFRDVTPWKRVEADLLAAKRQAEKASSAKSELLAKISHEIRTPLNAIIGFSEVMMEERFGPIANERYRDYVKDVHAAGGHLISLINDLLDLSKIEAGKLELTLENVSLNDLAQQCVALMQPQANRQRIIIRTSLPPDLPHVVADARSLRQIMLNLLSNSIKFTEAGGQVIVSTALSDDGNVVLRVRDSGIGMSEAEIATALEPFRQIETTIGGRAGGTGLGLPLTKALAEANRARFRIKSTPKEGTLVEIAFRTAEVLAG